MFRNLVLQRPFCALDTWAEESRVGPTVVIASINFEFVDLLQVKIELRGRRCCERHAHVSKQMHVQKDCMHAHKMFNLGSFC